MAIDSFWASLLVVAVLIAAAAAGWKGDLSDVGGVVKGAALAFPVLVALTALLYYRRKKEDKDQKTSTNDSKKDDT